MPSMLALLGLQAFAMPQAHPHMDACKERQCQEDGTAFLQHQFHESLGVKTCSDPDFDGNSTECQQFLDLCCNGEGVCETDAATIVNIRSLTCGAGACRDSNFNLIGDLRCSGINSSISTCGETAFILTGPQHVVEMTGGAFQFAGIQVLGQGGPQVSMSCENGSCAGSSIFFQDENACLDLSCPDGCSTLSVNAVTTVTCNYQGYPGREPTGCVGGPACNVQPLVEPCCQAAEGECETCCSDTATTTGPTTTEKEITASTTTAKKKPYRRFRRYGSYRFREKY